MIDEILEDYPCDICKSPYVDIVDILSISLGCGCSRTRMVCERDSRAMQNVVKSNKFSCLDHGNTTVTMNIISIGGNTCSGL